MSWVYLHMGWLGACVGVVAIGMQAVKIKRSNDVLGVSLETWSLLLVVFASWIIYGLAEPMYSQLLGNIPCALLVTAVLVSAWRLGCRIGRCVCIAGVGISVSVALCLLFGPTSTEWWAVGVGVVASLPQIRSIRRGGITTGVSIWSWFLNASGLACWLVYGVYVSNWGIVATAVWAISTSMAVVYSGIRNNRRHAGRPAVPIAGRSGYLDELRPAESLKAS